MLNPSTTTDATAEARLEPPVLSLRGISKAFDGNRVLHDVDLDIHAGQVHALVGENGAGKSTLMKIAVGVHRPDSGSMTLCSAVAGRGARAEHCSQSSGTRAFAPRTPADALAAGIAMVHQELSLAPDVSVAENIFVGREPCRGGLINWRELYRRTAEWLGEFCLDIDPAAPVSSLSIGYRQVVEILKALAARPRIIIFDEPTSSLEAHETAAVLETIRKLARRSIGVVYISHRLDEVFAVSDRVTVLRDGRLVLTGRTGQRGPQTRCWGPQSQKNAIGGPSAFGVPLTRDAVVNAMVGRELSELYPPRGCCDGPELLRVEHLTRLGAFQDVSFTLHRGEVLGFSGLVGSGRTELMRAIFGVDAPAAGRILVDGRPRRLGSVRDALAAGIAYLPEERKTLGLFLNRSVEDNIASASLRDCSAAGIVRPALTEALARDYCQRLAIKSAAGGIRGGGLADIAQEAASLSGGNQQKVLLARWMATRPKVLIVDEPTRGVDIGAKGEIHRMLREYADAGDAEQQSAPRRTARGAGHGVIVVSSEMPELLGLCDRIIVMREGQISGQVAAAEATEHDLINLAVGG